MTCTCASGRKGFLILAAAFAAPLLVYAVASATNALPTQLPVLGGSQAYMPALLRSEMFWGSILIGLIAGLITGVTGVGGGHVLTPALMTFGVQGIMAVGTVQFHLFAKGIIGTALHRKLGNVNFGLAAWFVLGSILGATAGGTINRAIFQQSPAMSDAIISTVYVVILGAIGLYTIADWRRLRSRRAGPASPADATTGFARWLQALDLVPRVMFDRDVVRGGRRVSIYPVILCGCTVGFVASIMGVGGGFLTFPMFVYGLGVSTFATVGTDILQIVFTAGYSSIVQYAIYGFVFYSVCIGMLIGSLVGVQVGAIVTKTMTGSQIRVFYALTILAGFANRLCALPRKLSDLGYLALSRPTTVAIEDVGKVLFFGIVAFFSIWALVVFFRNLRRVHAGEASRGPNGRARLIVSRSRLALGAAGLVISVALIVGGLIPLSGRRTALERADHFFNEVAKNSAYHVPEARKLAEKFQREPVDLGIRPRDVVDKAELAAVVTTSGMGAKVLEDGRVRVTGGLGRLACAAIDDADLAFRNGTDRLEGRYREAKLTYCDVLYCWWSVFDGLTRRYVQDNRGREADFTKFIAAKVLEPAYNFRGIEARRIGDNVLPVCALLGCYVLCTLLYGASLFYLFEGLGITSTAPAGKKEA